MIKWHRVEAKPGFEIVVNGRIEDKMLVHVDREDQVFFICFAPCLVDLQAIRSTCCEGIAHQVETMVRAQLQRSSLQEILRGAGYAIYRQPVTLTVEAFANREGLWAESRAEIQTFVQKASFFERGK